MSISIRDLVLMLVLIFFIPGVYGISLSISGGDAGDSVGSTTKLAAPDDGTVNLQATIGSTGGASLSQSLSSSGDLHESHFVQNKKGHRAETSVDVVNAAGYTYGYTIYPGAGYGWSSKYVSAGECLTVHNADYIRAGASASNTKGYTASAGLELWDYYSHSASVEDYSNYAEASDDRAIASQKMGPVAAYNFFFGESSSNTKNSASHYLYGDYGGTLDCYSAKADVTKNGGANVAADYAQLNARTVWSDGAGGSYSDILKNVYYSSSTGYSGFDSSTPVSLSAYSTKASSKGTATTAKSTLQAAGSPGTDYYLEYGAGAPGYGRSIPINDPGKYSAVAQFNGKKLYVNVAPVL